MSCYHPLIGIPTGELTENGKKRYFIKSLKQTTDKKEIFRNENIILIPCGKCLGCRCDYSRNWADRMMLELDETKKAVFLTLTYNNEHLPIINDNETGEEISTLNKRDCQLFIKRLRKEFGEYRLKFFLSAEYGDATDRPHYHCVIFGIDRTDIGDCVYYKQNELGNPYFLSKRLQKVWSDRNGDPIGFIVVADVNWKTCAYVARYVVKKLNGKMLEDRYGSSGRVNNFSLMSRKPGIGRNFLDKHPEVLDLKKFNLSTPEGGLEIYLPKYYIKQLIKEPSEKFPNPLYDPEKYDKMVKQRKKFANDAMLIELSKTNLSLVDYLEKKELKKYSDMQKKRRNKV